ncbi:hypothetical protein LSUE1_G002347 [Lachnellula suecica]|uniref:Tautomerase cis-CaaD-like domain-containing protein n=1 Tax=Lachnellula suecica TaxID=602035 RepID=A0A8T9CH33_9HELO|nr:hypothetical protein LSUE1_G002347 [Lachnellula suecica]
MPLYEVSHCVPLSREQKDAIAEFITDLHATTFVTPRQFVNVAFEQPAPIGAIYSGAKLRGQTKPNFIRASIRVGPSRPKEKYDEVGLKIQKRWDEVVNDAALGAYSFDKLPAKEAAQVKKLKGIVFFPFVAALEDGLVVPGPADEATWLKDNMVYFQEQVDVHDNDDIREMLKEVNEREDFKKLLQ